jgi:hypothetical protein
MIVLSLCDKTGNMVKPWVEAGYEAWIVDLQHPVGETRDGSLVRVGTDIRYWTPPKAIAEQVGIVFAFPPCTHLAVSGARWFRGKGLRALSEAIDIFGACVNLVEWLGVPGFVENPVSVISSHYRKPDHTFDPCDYGDPWLKKTCLWTFGGFVMPPKQRVEPVEGSKMHLMGPSADRADRRSETPMGFAEAVFNANARRPDRTRSRGTDEVPVSAV